MTLTEMLIGKADKITALPEKELEISRLSELCGEPFIIKIKALPLSVYDSMPKEEGMRTYTLLRGIISPSLSDEALRRAYTPKERKNPITAKELAEKLFLAGEIANIASEILALSGFNEDAVKNVDTALELENLATEAALKN